jgi:hypothetical protein
MSKRPSALLQSIAEAQETEKKIPKPPTPDSSPLLTYDEKRRFKKTTCYFSELQLTKFDDIADGIKKKTGKKVRLPDIARFLIETCNTDDVVERMTARR